MFIAVWGECPKNIQGPGAGAGSSRGPRSGTGAPDGDSAVTCGALIFGGDAGGIWSGGRRCGTGAREVAVAGQEACGLSGEFAFLGAEGLLELLRYADASEAWAVAAQEAAKVPLKRSSALDAFQNCIEAFKPKEKKLK